MERIFIIEENTEGQLIEHLPSALLTWQRYGCTRTAWQIYESGEEINFHSVTVDLQENEKIWKWKKVITETPIFEEIEGEQVQIGVDIDITFEPVIIPLNWTNEERHVRITTPISISEEVAYQAYFRRLYLLKVPFDSDPINEMTTYYFLELNKADGFSITSGVIAHIDPRLIIEQFGTFTDTAEKIIQVND